MTQKIDWQVIETFIGFGRLDAPVVFIGMEEGLQSGADLERDLLVRSTYRECEDLLAAQTGLGEPSKFFGTSPKCQRTWRPMCHLMLRRGGVEHPTPEQRNRYQADLLGRADGDTLLCELMPYPCTNTSIWQYQSRYATRDEYYRELLPKRLSLLRGVLLKNAPELVVCYGKRDWPAFEQLADGRHYQVRGLFKLAQIGKTRLVLSPHFSQRSFNTQAQLDTFADVALDDGRLR